MPALRILSLGWGVQSFTLACKIACGELQPVDYAVFADTGFESEGTYKLAQEMTPYLESCGVKVRTVMAAPEDRRIIREWSNSHSVMPPFFTKDQDGREGQIERQCTKVWKVTPIRRFIRGMLAERGIASLTATPPAGCVESIQGISYDEWERMRTSDVQYIENAYPLVDLRLTRSHCKLWLEAEGFPIPPKSACVFCPFHKIGDWAAMKREGGSDWTRALEVDEEIAEAYQERKRRPIELYLHPRRQRLLEAVRIVEDVGASQPELGICDGGVCDV